MLSCHRHVRFTISLVTLSQKEVAVGSPRDKDHQVSSVGTPRTQPQSLTHMSEQTTDFIDFAIVACDRVGRKNSANGIFAG